MRLIIKRYDSVNDYFFCEDTMGVLYRLDLFSGSSYVGFGELDTIENYSKLIGRTIEVEDTFPYISFAKNVELLKDISEFRDPGLCAQNAISKLFSKDEDKPFTLIEEEINPTT